MADLNGKCDPRFQRVYDALATNIDAGKEIGASLYVNVEGEDVIDLSGGWRDRERTVRWTEDTIVNVFSCSKTVSSLAVLMLIDRGLIDLYAPVARYWPEFAQNGKEKAEVRHLLSHSVGLPGWEQPFTLQDAMDADASAARLAAQAPWWEPGARSSYHASTFGHLIAELVRRVSGKTLREFIDSEIAGPVGADFYLGLSKAQLGRVATIYPADEETRPAISKARSSSTDDLSVEQAIGARTRLGNFSGMKGDLLEMFNSPEWRRSEFGGSSGHANARGIGRIISALCLDGVSRGVKLISPETIDLIFHEQSNALDGYFMRQIRWGIGYALASEESNARGPLPFLKPSKRTCFWSGRGGSLAITDVGRRVTVAYAMNQSKQGRNSLNGVYYDAVYDCL